VEFFFCAMDLIFTLSIAIMASEMESGTACWICWIGFKKGCRINSIFNLKGCECMCSFKGTPDFRFVK